jgi:hypothetical protein
MHSVVGFAVRVFYPPVAGSTDLAGAISAEDDPKRAASGRSGSGVMRLAEGARACNCRVRERQNMDCLVGSTFSLTFESSQLE